MTRFCWVLYQHVFGQLLHRCRAHCTLDHRGYLPTAVVITDGRTNEVRAHRPLRRVALHTDDGTTLALLTNHLGLGATTIARLYNDRWQIELLLKALKQHLRVRTSVGTSINAPHIQIWTALIALLLLKYLQLRARFGLSLSNLVALLRINLFVYRDLWVWIDDPFTAPPVPPEPTQGARRRLLELPFILNSEF